MKIKLLEVVGTVFIIAGFAITPDRGNTEINLLAQVVSLSLGAACFLVNKRSAGR